jgi:hypothetical protein
MRAGVSPGPMQMRAGVSPVPIDADAREEGRYRAHASPHVRRPQRSTRALEHEGGPMRRSPCSSVNGLFACASVSGMVCLLVRACVGFSGAGGSPPQPGTGPTTHQPAAATAAPNADGSARLCVRACAACACERESGGGEGDAIYSESRHDVVDRDAIYSESRPDVVDRDAIYSESRHDVVDRDAIYRESRHDVARSAPDFRETRA